MAEVPEDVIWRTMTGVQSHFAIGSGGVRRYADGFSPILVFADVANPDFDSLMSCCQPGDRFYCERWSGSPPEGWSIEAESTMFKMIYEGPTPEPVDDDDMVELGPQHAQQALDLALLTNPGPFGLRTLELGSYYGYFDDDRLIAMAGERFDAPPLREVSGVCTHPNYVGRGYAKRLMHRVMREEMERGQIPFLHVLSHNEVAHGMYLRMGFRDSLETIVRIVKRVSA
ncbi:MAG: GNAT family N-acetyltransferase [Armatimonadetes bacterium]|nr:GNAT family N-acetyltransferase [Armatimonadota bacterium]